MAPISLDTPLRRSSVPRRQPTSASRADLSEQPCDRSPELQGQLEDNTATNSITVSANTNSTNGAGNSNSTRRNGTPTEPATSSLLQQQSPSKPPTPRSTKPISGSRGSTLTPQKKRRYIPGGPGGGGRYVDEDGNEEPVGGTGPGGYNYAGPRGVVGRENARRGIGVSPSASSNRPRAPYIRPERRRREEERLQKPGERTSERTRTVPERRARVHINLSRELGSLARDQWEQGGERNQMSFSGTAMASMAAKADGGYKPREERGWEEFHPELDTEVGLPVFTAGEVDGTDEPEKEASASATPEPRRGSRDGSVNALRRSVTPAGETNGLQRQDSISGTPGSKRRTTRPSRDPVAWASRVGKVNGTPASAPASAPRIAPLQNQNAKERLTLPQPSFRKVNTFEKFEGMGHKVDRSMANVGYQDTDIWVRPKGLIKMSDSYLEDDNDTGTAGTIGRVEYDMDEQDDAWLSMYNAQYRKPANVETISHEMFEMTITKIEKEWHALEKRIPKPNPKPPQTQRPRSSSAAAVNGDPSAAEGGEEPDSKCAICDDGDCENTNAIVFCDGCDLAVHQECYGVPFIPEGQWLCRKCQLIGRGIPTCIFCPNTDGGFKQTNSSRWAHLLCAMWIPEVSLGNHIFMEPVMDVEKVPKPRWKLSCYICNQQMGACIQCGNKACYQAFHVTCARRARLFLKMKNSTGTLIELDGGTHLKAFCDKHCPMEYARENEVARATREAKQFYRQTMKGRIWADSQAAALAIAANHPDAALDHNSNETRPKHRLSFSLGSNKKRKEEPQKNAWKLPSGAPVVPAYVFDIVATSLQRFGVRKYKEWVAAACKYWTLKRESRRGAALLKRLQLPMEPFSSMEITRRNFVAMGEAGRLKLERRREFVALLLKDMERLREISDLALEREVLKLEEARLEKEVFDLTYFPVARLLPPIIEKAISIDKPQTFTPNLHQLLHLTQSRYYVLATVFATDLAAVFREGLTSLKDTLPDEPDEIFSSTTDYNAALKEAVHEVTERKKLAKKIIKAIQPALSDAIRAEGDVSKWEGEQLTAKLADLDFALEACIAVTPEEILGPARKDPSTSADELAAEPAPILPPTSSYAPILPPGSAAKKATPQPTAPAPTAPVAQVFQNIEMELHDEDAEGEEIDEDDIFTPIPSVPSTTREASAGTDEVKTEPPKEVAGINGTIVSMPPPPARASKEPTPPVAPVASTGTRSTVPNSDDTISAPSKSKSPSKSPTPSSAAGDFITRGGLPWYLREAEYDPRTESFPKEPTPTPSPSPSSPPAPKGPTPPPATSSEKEKEVTPEPELEAEQPDTSPLSSPAPEIPEPSLPLGDSPMAQPEDEKGDEVMAGVAQEHPSEAETVRLPDPMPQPSIAGEDDKMLLDDPQVTNNSTERGGGMLEVGEGGIEASSSGGELSDMDDDELDGLGAGMEIGDGVVGIRRGYRKRKKVSKALG